MPTEPRPRYAAIQPHQARSYWQPEPANGHASVLLTPDQTVSGKLAMGVQSVAPGGHVREHAHPEQEELIFVLAGTGIAVIEGAEHTMLPGALFYLGPNATHSFINRGQDDLVYSWTMTPPGLEKFFGAIGRPRAEGESPPTPFPRPQDVRQIELGTVFVDLQALRRPAADRIAGDGNAACPKN